MGESIEQKLASHLSEPVQFPNPWPNAIPREFRTLIEKLLAKNPAERFASYDELIDQLQVIAPVSTTPAGFAPRLMAYVVDQICLLAAIAPFAISIFAIQGTDRSSLKLLTPIIAFASLIVPALYLLMIYKGWRSPGICFNCRLSRSTGYPQGESNWCLVRFYEMHSLGSFPLRCTFLCSRYLSRKGLNIPWLDFLG
jgi:serine/threonine protein kinase